MTREELNGEQRTKSQYIDKADPEGDRTNEAKPQLHI